jgi:ribosomal protein S18 acetylase RimI-like enzyme
MTICRSISLGEVEAIDPIPSGFETNRAFRLERIPRADDVTWRLFEQALSTPFHKRYDGGDLREWLGSYEEEARLEDIRFLAALDGDTVQGLLTWRQLEWNSTVWLIDIRVRDSARRSGVGSLLIERLKAIAAESGSRGISVETQISNHPAVQFYRRNGFELTGFNDHLYANDDLDRQDVALFLFWEAEPY